VANCANVNVGFITFKLLFCHDGSPYIFKIN